MKFSTVNGTMAYKLYENLVKKGFATSYEIPGDFTIIKGKKVLWERYCMSREQLGNFLKGKI